MKITKIMIAALGLCGIFLLGACGGGEAPKANAPKADAPKTDAPKADAPKADAPKTDVASADSIGVPECDDYIKKYEACLLKVAEKAPQVKDQMKTSFETARNGWKQAASTPQGKATLASACKQAADAAKQAMSAYACEF